MTLLSRARRAVPVLAAALALGVAGCGEEDVEGGVERGADEVEQAGEEVEREAEEEAGPARPAGGPAADGRRPAGSRCGPRLRRRRRAAC